MQTDDIDIITALDGREVDITKEIGKLIHISRRYRADDDLDPRDRQFIHRLGWGLMVVCGPKAPVDLVDDMEESEEINPAFAAHLRDRWADLVARCA
jgi:hypothetical protein